MKKLLVLFAAGILAASSSASAQCTSCAGSAPSFQSAPYASAPVYSGGYMGQPMNYVAPVSYSSAPAYAQPMMGQPVYNQPVYSQPCCSQPVYSQPMYQGGCCGQSYGTPVSYAQPMAYSSYPSSQGCGACGGSHMVYGQGNVIYQNPAGGVIGGNANGVIAAPMDASSAPAANSTQPPAPATGNPPTPEETGTDSTPAPEDNKDGET